jgi:hypothetical protein
MSELDPNADMSVSVNVLSLSNRIFFGIGVRRFFDIFGDTGIERIAEAETLLTSGMPSGVDSQTKPTPMPLFL